MDLTAVKSGERDMKWLEVAIKTRTSIEIRTRFESFRLIVCRNDPFLCEVCRKILILKCQQKVEDAFLHHAVTLPCFIMGYHGFSYDRPHPGSGLQGSMIMGQSFSQQNYACKILVSSEGAES